jgi:hypothetical protein
LGDGGIGDIIIQHYEYGTDVNAIKYTDKYTHCNRHEYADTDALASDHHLPSDCRSGGGDDQLCGGSDCIIGVSSDVYFGVTEHLYGEWHDGNGGDAGGMSESRRHRLVVRIVVRRIRRPRV